MKNSVAVVTGASQGIGRSTAIRLAKDFSSVVLVARNAQELDETAAEVCKSGAEPLTIALDLSQVASPETVIKVVAFVVYYNEGRKVVYLDAPDCFHPEFRELKNLDLTDTVLCELCRRTAHAAKVKASMCAAGILDGL